jgi:hypothetical protein
VSTEQLEERDVKWFREWMDRDVWPVENQALLIVLAVLFVIALVVGTFLSIVLLAVA